MQGLSHPLKPTAFVGKRAASLKKAAICERQLNEAGQSWGNFMSIVDDLPPPKCSRPLIRWLKAMVEFDRTRASKW